MFWEETRVWGSQFNCDLSRSLALPPKMRGRFYGSIPAGRGVVAMRCRRWVGLVSET